jgi:glycosyltransferase involved in cell wall biosynthesis
MTMRISAVIITKNEARNIERCLLSLQDTVDEIVVVDSFSTDETEAICRKYKVCFFQREWMGYAEQKNNANMLATHNMIVSIDADEALSPELQKSILRLKQTGKQNVVGKVNRLNNYCGKWIRHGRWYPDWKIRIFNRTNAQWTGILHERIEYPSDTEIYILTGNLLHYSYYTVEEHLRQANLFTTLAAMEDFEKRKTVSFVAIYLKTGWTMIRDYLFKLGFLDGYYGYIICKINAFSSFLKYSKLYELNRKKKG